jgi:hypothetical protein
LDEIVCHACIYRINNLQGDFNMLGLIKKLFGGKPAEPVAVPYKVETPPVEVAQPAVEPTAAEVSAENKAVAVAKAKRAPAKKAPIKKAPAPKAPRKPKAP